MAYPILFRLTWSALAILALSYSTETEVAHAQSASLSDTLSWINDTYNQHPGGSFGYGDVELLSDGKVFRHTVDTFSSVGCLVTMHETEVWLESGKPSLINNLAYTFNLKDIDPKSLVTSETESGAAGISCSIAPDDTPCDTSMLQLETFNQRPLMTTEQDEIFPNLSGKDHESKGNGASFVAWFYFNDLTYAPRFVAALKHAIELCGGKPSAF